VRHTPRLLRLDVPDTLPTHAPFALFIALRPSQRAVEVRRREGGDVRANLFD
jgi:hypothetical protein